MERTRIVSRCVCLSQIALVVFVTCAQVRGQQDQPEVRFLEGDSKAAPTSYQSTENPKALPDDEPTIIRIPKAGPLPAAGAQPRPLPVSEPPPIAIPVIAQPTRSINPAVFLRTIEAGKTPAADVVMQLGEPVVQEPTATGARMNFKLPGYRTISVETAGDSVVRVQGEFETPISLPEFLKAWSLEELTAAMVPNSNLQVVGQAFPERGIVAYFQPKQRVALISQFDIRPTAPQLYLWRVQHGYDYSYAKRFADVQRAARLNPSNPETSWMRARLLLEIEKPSEALNEVEAALAVSVDTARYRITRGEALLALGNVEAATADFQAIAESTTATLVERAQAETQWGRIYAIGAAPDYPASMAHHQKAIDLAAKAARESGPLAARQLQRVLIDAHFGGAQAVALGPWKGGQQAATQWMAKANSFTKMYIDREKGDPVELIRTRRRAIELLDVMNKEIDPSAVLTACEEEGKSLIAKTDDETTRQQIQWELAQAYFRGARLMRRQGKMEGVNKYYSKAYDIVKSQEESREATPQFNYFMGNVYFFAGSLYAVNQEDHTKALPIYDRALQYYARPLGPGMLAESGLHGERYVSMGVTYWQAGKRKQAIVLSEEGLKLMENASGRGALPRSELSVPYANLAHMKSEVGDKETAAKYLRVSAELETVADQK